MEDNNEIEGTHNSALGEFSVLSPSQKKEQEQKKKEQERQKQAKAAQVAAQKAKEQKEIERMETRAQMRWTGKMLLWLAVTIVGVYFCYAYWIKPFTSHQEVTLEGLAWFIGFVSPGIVFWGGLKFIETIIAKKQ